MIQHGKLLTQWNKMQQYKITNIYIFDIYQKYIKDNVFRMC